jgi:lipopolysaccharide export system protein LptA
MTKNKKIVQLTLLFIGLILILATYFIYPEINKNKFIEQKLKEDKKIALESGKDVSNTFENIEYNAFYNIEHPFTVQSEKAFILAEEPDVVYMTSMKVTLYINDRVIVITSDKGSYNKATFDCFLRLNVQATDGDTIIKGDNLDFLSNQEKVDIYNNVNLVNEKISMVADKINYNFKKKFYKISMFDDKNVNIKLIQ